MPITVADLNVRVRADMRDAKTGLQQIQGEGQKAATGTAGAFSKAAPVISKAFTVAGAGIGAGLLAGTGAAAQLADEMANVATVVPTADIAGLTDQVQDLSKASGVSTTDLTGGLYDLVSAGVDASDAMDVLKASTNLAIGGLGTTAGAADVVTSAMNAYGLSAKEAGGITDVFALAIQRGKVTADEIGASIANIAPIASSAGVGLDEVSAAYGTLTAKGVPAAQATTQMRAAISALLTPNEQLNRLQQQTGINFADLAKEKGLGVALEELRKATAGNATALDKLAGVSAKDFPKALKAAQKELGLTNSDVEKFSAMAGKDGAGAALAELAQQVGSGDSAFGKALGSVEAYQFALNTTGSSAADFQGQVDDYSAALAGSGVAAEQAAIKMDSPVEAGKRLFATFQTFLQDVGGPFASSLGPIVFALNQMGPAMAGLPRLATAAGGAIGALAGKALPKLASGFASLGPKLAPKITGLADSILPKLTSGFAGLGKKLVPSLSGGLSGAFSAVVPKLGGAVSGLISGITGLASAAMPLLAAAWPLLLAGAIVAGIALLLSNPEIRDAVFGFIGGIIDWIGKALSGLAKFLGDIFGAAFQAIGTVISTWLTVVTAPIRFVIDLVSKLFSGVAPAANTAWSAVSTIVGTAIGVITAPIKFLIGLVGAIWNGVAAAAGAVWNAVSGIVKGAGQVLGAVFGAIGAAAKVIFDGVVAIVSAVWNAISTIISTVAGVIKGIFGAVGAAAGAIWNGISGAASAAWNAVTGVVKGAVGAITGIIGGIADVARGVWDTVTGIFGGIKDAASNAVGFVGDVAGNVGGFFGQFIPHFQEGAWSTAEGPAYLHRGEMVLPPDLAARFRSFIGGETTTPAAAPAMAAAGSGPTTVYVEQTVEVPVSGLLRAEKPADIAEALRRVADLGYLSPPAWGRAESRR